MSLGSSATRLCWGLKIGAVIVFERGNAKMLTFQAEGNWPENSVWCTDDDIIERGQLFKIQHNYAPPNYYVYVRPEDLVPLWR